jgi:hypothetical protein
VSTNEKSKLKALIDISEIDTSLGFDDILQNILKITCDNISGNSGTIMLVDDNTGELRMVRRTCLQGILYWVGI